MTNLFHEFERLYLSFSKSDKRTKKSKKKQRSSPDSDNPRRYSFSIRSGPSIVNLATRNRMLAPVPLRYESSDDIYDDTSSELYLFQLVERLQVLDAGDDEDSFVDSDVSFASLDYDDYSDAARMPRSSPDFVVDLAELAGANVEGSVHSLLSWEEIERCPSNNSLNESDNAASVDCDADDDMDLDKDEDIAAFINYHAIFQVPDADSNDECQLDMYTRYQNHFEWDLAQCEEWITTVKIMDMPLITAEHREYRRFRYYDLVRVKLGNSEPVDLQPFMQNRVHFSVKLQSRQFRSDSIVAPKSEAKCEENQSSSERPSILLVKKAAPRQKPPPITVEFIEVTSDLDMKLGLARAVEKVLYGNPLELSEMTDLLMLALDHASECIENILRAFEAISQTGKRFISLINRLQALANRYLVLNDETFRRAVKDKVSLSQLLGTLLSDSQCLHEEVADFQAALGGCQRYMHDEVDGLVANASECLDFLDQCKSVVLMGSPLRAALTVSPVTWDERYLKNLQFLHNLRSERIFRFLVGDFDKMMVDSQNMSAVCGTLLRECEVSYNEVSVFE